MNLPINGGLVLMDPSIVTRKRRQLALRFGLFGLVIAVAFATYFQTNPGIGSSADFAGLAALFLCPGSFLFVSFIDAEPRTGAFLFVWVAIAVINFGLYGAIGVLVSRFRWRLKSEPFGTV